MPGIIALGVIAAAFINLVISVTAQREAGVLNRRRETPVPAAAVMPPLAVALLDNAAGTGLAPRTVSSLSAA